MEQESTIGNLFRWKNRVFEIPSYQRAYSWEKKQILQFIEDLRTAGGQYYLGHFLFEKKEDNDTHTLLIIDGQQRLTTCIIFFSCVRKVLKQRKSNGENFSLDLDDITDYYLRDIRKGTQKFKTVRDDNTYFTEEIIEGKAIHAQLESTQSIKRIKEARLLFENELEKTETKEIERWCELIEKAAITEYIVTSKTQAAQIFAFQNDRGKPLSNLEVIKAFFMLQIYLFGPNPKKTEEDIRFLEAKFSEIYRQIVRIQLTEDEVLNYYWRAVSGKGFYSEEVVRGVKDTVISTPLATADEKDKKIEWIKEFISGLSQAFQTVEKFETSNFGYAKDLQYLKNMALSYPFIIKAYKLHANEKSIERLIRLLENITFRYLLRGGRAEIESRLNPHLINYNSAEEIDKNINDMIYNMKSNNWWWYWNTTSLKSYLDRSDFYGNRVDNYILWKYELHLCGVNYSQPRTHSFDDFIHNENIEHIAPQTPTNGDPIANGYGDYENKINPENGVNSGGWIHRLGNLMLISQLHNIAIGNKPFEDKLKSYTESDPRNQHEINLLNQQREIVHFVSDKENPTWDKTAIEKRHKKLIDAAMDIWDLDKI